jgi:hypothetical protein
MENGPTSVTTVAEGNVNFGSRLEGVPDESRLLSLLDAISDEDVPRLLHKRYRPTYLNLFALLRRQASATRIRELAVQLRIFTIFHPGIFTIIHPPLGFAF